MLSKPGGRKRSDHIMSCIDQFCALSGTTNTQNLAHSVSDHGKDDADAHEVMDHGVLSLHDAGVAEHPSGALNMEQMASDPLYLEEVISRRGKLALAAMADHDTKPPSCMTETQNSVCRANCELRDLQEHTSSGRSALASASTSHAALAQELQAASPEQSLKLPRLPELRPMPVIARHCGQTQIDSWTQPSSASGVTTELA